MFGYFLTLSIKGLNVILVLVIGIIYLVHTQNFTKNLTFLPPDTHTYLCISGDKKCYFLRKFHVRTK